jgi:hypothetical protein
MIEYLSIAVFAVLAAASVVFGVCYFVRWESFVGRWAKRQGYRVMTQQQRAPFRGPFLLNEVGGRHVYRVTVEDRTGKRKSGWILCGGWYFGPLLSDDVREVWDD